MVLTEDVSWVRLIHKDGFWLEDTGRLTSILQDMPNPKFQTPQLLQFIGSTLKDKSIREIFPGSYSRRNPLPGLINLRVENSTMDSSTPLLLADSDPFLEPRQGAVNSDSNYISMDVKWTAGSTSQFIDVFLARFSFIFSDVVCIFTEDFPDFRTVAIRLVEWAKQAQSYKLPSALPPTVILVFSDPGGQQQMEDYISGPEWKEIGNIFNLLPPFYLNYSESQRHSRLKNALLSSLEDIRDQRRERGFLMNCHHFAAFSRLALDHVASTVTSPFDLICATRKDNPIGEDFFQHVSTFLQLGSELHISHNDLASFIASAILMDAYPPNMHCFLPREVFHALYISACSRAINQTFGRETAATLPNLIQGHLERLFDNLITGSSSSAQIHEDNLSLHSRHWSQMRSNETCLFCIRRKPEEHVLSCGHTICDQCPRIYGHESTEADQKFVMPDCILCKCPSNLTTTLNPPTANLSILSIDGGGTRGVIPLEILSAMQELIETPLVDLFDLSAGTSSGMSIANFLKHNTEDK